MPLGSPSDGEIDGSQQQQPAQPLIVQVVIGDGAASDHQPAFYTLVRGALTHLSAASKLLDSCSQNQIDLSENTCAKLKLSGALSNKM